MTKKTNITDIDKERFEALTSGEYNNFALMSCFVDGEPASAIAVVNEDAAGGPTILPIFVSVTDKMVLTDHEGVTAEYLEKKEKS